MDDGANESLARAKPEALERTSLSAAEVIALALTAGFAMVGGGSLLLIVAII